MKNQEWKENEIADLVRKITLETISDFQSVLNGSTDPMPKPAQRSLDDLEIDVVIWANERGILTHSDVLTQILKSASELGELADAVAKNDRDLMIDAFGDFLVTIILVKVLFFGEKDRSLSQYDFEGQRLESWKIREPKQRMIDLIGEFANLANAIKSDVNHFYITHVLTSVLENLNRVFLAVELDGVSLRDCLERALETISARSGKMVNGIFVKDGEATA